MPIFAAQQMCMFKAGILGGGQLGKMLLQAAANYPVETYLMENDAEAPAAHLCHHFTLGDITSFDDVYRFGKGLDALTIEIESVNEDALDQLEREGVAIVPRPSALRLIKNKIRQKEYYAGKQIPTAPFVVTRDLEDLRRQLSFLPAVHKIAEGGYDGRGVQVIRNGSELEKGFERPAVLEKLVDIEKEIAQMVAVDKNGALALYPPVDMVFDPGLNLLDYQVSPADIPEKLRWKIEAISLAVVRGFNSPGVFAVELFIDKSGEVFVNETAPRVHNSGHHTIEGNYCSQFDMLWRIILGYPLGNPGAIVSSALVNLLGEEGFDGPARYEGMEEVMKMEHVFVHIYGKARTKPGRKMGHVTILENNQDDLAYAAHRIKKLLKVLS